MESLVVLFSNTLGQFVSREVVIFIISMIPILELRGGLLAASLLQVPITTAIPICVIGNIIPIPFILLFIKVIFKWLKPVPFIGGIITKLEDRAMNKSNAEASGEFVGLMLFVGIPLPGTGAWTGTLAASILDMDFKTSIRSVILGVLLAGVIMGTLSYLGFGMLFGL